MAFRRNARGELVSDRRFNTTSILSTYLGPDAVGPDQIAWNIDDPNKLRLELPGAMAVSALAVAVSSGQKTQASAAIYKWAAVALQQLEHDAVLPLNHASSQIVLQEAPT